MDIDERALRDIWKHHRSLAWQNIFRGISYERCAELPYIINLFKPQFSQELRYLDIGSGESPLPTYLLKQSQWDIWCLDKFSWVQMQHTFAHKTMDGQSYDNRFHVIEGDLFRTQLPRSSFDMISNVSVIEHFESNQDSLAMETSAALLKAGGRYILTTLINDGHFKEFYLTKNVYGEEYRNEPIFYQRHYDLDAIRERIIKPSGLREISRIYFGDYGFQWFEKMLQKVPKAIRVSYQWATPIIAKHFLRYDAAPISRDNMMMNTASGVILVLVKE